MVRDLQYAKALHLAEKKNREPDTGGTNKDENGAKGESRIKVSTAWSTDSAEAPIWKTIPARALWN